MVAGIPSQYKRDVVLSFRFEADISRVFNALSIPEYIEAWLQAPDAEELRFAFDPAAQQTFRVDFYRAATVQATVHGSCCVQGANRVRYIWKTSSPLGSAETAVDMQLRLGLSGCILGLKHSGFQNVVESAWCCKMWYRSLERLGRLLGKN